MPRLKILLVTLPATWWFLCGVPAYGHGCGHHGGCASSYHHDHGCYGCGSWSGSRTGSEEGPASKGGANTQTHEGKVAEVIYLPGATPDMAIVELRLVSGGATIPMRLGPAGFLKRNQLNLKEGDTVAVTGFRVSTPGGDLLVATEVSMQGKTVRFRDRWGRSSW